MKVTLQILETKREIIDAIIEATIPLLNRLLIEVATVSKPTIQHIVKEEIKDSPEYQSMVDGRGQLHGSLGIVDPISQLDAIIDIITSDIEMVPVPAQKVGKTVTGGFRLEVVRGNYEDILNSNLGSFVSENNFVVPWLQWLLTAGTSRVVQDYVVKFGPSPFSRTGLAVMAKKAGGGYSIPNEFAGTPEDNFITRALNKANDKILDIIQKSMESV